MKNGKEFHGEVDDAVSGTAFTLYLAGETDAYTLADDEQIVITDASVFSGNAGRMIIGADADGYRLEINNSLSIPPSIHLRTPFYYPRGEVPTVVNDAGAGNSATIVGFIIGT